EKKKIKTGSTEWTGGFLSCPSCESCPISGSSLQIRSPYWSFVVPTQILPFVFVPFAGFVVCGEEGFQCAPVLVNGVAIVEFEGFFESAQQEFEPLTLDQRQLAKHALGPTQQVAV